MNADLIIRAFHKPLEIRTVKKTGYLEKGLQGYAVVYGVESRDMGGWKEIMTERALSKSLGKKLDVRALFQHDSAQVLARQSAGNLVLTEDSNGVCFEMDLVDKEFNRGLIADVEARNLDAMSFGMPRDSMKKAWDKPTKDRNYAVCRVMEADIVEISVVTWAAYEETTLSARSLEAMQTEYKTFMQHDAAGKQAASGILRARQALAHSRYRY